ncbi:MAG: sigma-70 family RNA polymerase sigma factor [Propionibacteriaceae bacterium]|jgi:RNA polymerase sigma factor (sigma-70 family)|nr:sigma-70 family RNA polymerase sigma factor [Propionibacteriaceae bacterium]
MPHARAVRCADETPNALIEACRRGDEQALAQLYEAYYPMALRFARRHVACRQDAEDLAQDAFISVAGALRRGETEVRHFSAYLATAVRRLAGRRAQRKAWELPVEDPSRVARSGAEHLPHDGDLESAFKSLSARRRAAAWLRVVEGRPLREVGQHLGVSPAAAGMVVHRSLAQLRAAYHAQTAGQV